MINDVAFKKKLRNLFILKEEEIGKICVFF